MVFLLAPLLILLQVVTEGKDCLLDHIQKDGHLLLIMQPAPFLIIMEALIFLTSMLVLIQIPIYFIILVSAPLIIIMPQRLQTHRQF